MAGVVVALGAQATLYLTLRRIAVATMPAWAHGHVHHPMISPVIPSVVGVALMGSVSAPAASEPSIAAPAMQPVPLLEMPPPDLAPGVSRP